MYLFSFSVSLRALILAFTSSSNLLLQYPHSSLSTSEKESFYLGTLTYDPSDDYTTCKDLLCHFLPVKSSQEMELEDLPSSISLSMLQNRVKSKQYYQEMNHQQQHIESLLIKTDLAGEIVVNIHRNYDILKDE